MHDVDQELTANGEFLPWLYSQNQPSTTWLRRRHSAQRARRSVQNNCFTLYNVAAHSNLHLNLTKCVLLRSPASQNTVHFKDGTRLTIAQHALASHLAAMVHHTRPRRLVGLELLSLRALATAHLSGDVFRSQSAQTLPHPTPVLVQHRPH